MKQYYHKNDKCKAEDAHHPECICWNDQGTGPYKETTPEEASGLHWRDKPGSPKIETGCPCCSSHALPDVRAAAVDANTFVGYVDCASCTLTITEQYGESTEDKAKLSALSLWNTVVKGQKK